MNNATTKGPVFNPIIRKALYTVEYQGRTFRMRACDNAHAKAQVCARLGVSYASVDLRAMTTTVVEPAQHKYA